jgi:hypothetical protein
MYRKRHNPTASFKLPNPHDPVTGNWAPLSMSAPYCRATLDTAMTTADEKVYGHITHQWGPGARHSFQDRIAVYNFLVTEATETEAAVYLHSKEADEAVFCVWDASQKWVMVGGMGGGGNSVATTSTIIPPREGNTPGGPITVLKKKICDPSAAELGFCDNGEVEVYSWVKTASSDPAEEDGGVLWIFIEQDEQGIWWFTGQDCPPGGA